MTQVQAIMTPWSPVGDFALMWLQMLPVTVLVAWLTGRLLGVRRRSLLMAFAAGSAGSRWWGARWRRPARSVPCCCWPACSPWRPPSAYSCWPGHRPQASVSRALPTGVPHPLRWLRQHSTAGPLPPDHPTGRPPRPRPLPGPGPGRQPDGRRSPRRRARLALEQAGGMFVKLGQMLSTRPDVVPPALAHELAGLQEHMAPPTRQPSGPWSSRSWAHRSRRSLPPLTGRRWPRPRSPRPMPPADHR